MHSRLLLVDCNLGAKCVLVETHGHLCTSGRRNFEPFCKNRKKVQNCVSHSNLTSFSSHSHCQLTLAGQVVFHAAVTCQLVILAKNTVISVSNSALYAWLTPDARYGDMCISSFPLLFISFAFECMATDTTLMVAGTKASTDLIMISKWVEFQFGWTIAWRQKEIAAKIQVFTCDGYMSLIQAWL